MIIRFSANDKNYDSLVLWCKENPAAYFLKLNNARNGQLHRTSCPAHFDSESSQFAVPQTGCSSDISELIQWGVSKKRKITACSDCFPNGYRSLKSSPAHVASPALLWPFPNPLAVSKANVAKPNGSTESINATDWGEEEPMPDGTLKSKTTVSEVTQHERDANVKAWVWKQAQGICECCEKPSPFNDADGMPYLEVHHVRKLADEGSDRPSNAVALCPNCHRELHYGENAQKLVAAMYKRINRLIRE